MKNEMCSHETLSSRSKPYPVYPFSTHPFPTPSTPVDTPTRASELGESRSFIFKISAQHLPVRTLALLVGRPRAGPVSCCLIVVDGCFRPSVPMVWCPTPNGRHSRHFILFFIFAGFLHEVYLCLRACVCVCVFVQRAVTNDFLIFL